MKLNIEKNISLADHTTLKVGGVADHFVEVSSVEELKEVLEFAKQTPAPPLILGGGSNILVSDEGYRGLVIKNSITGRSFEKTGDVVSLTCGAGEMLDEVVSDTVLQDLWGMENLSSIPGTIGATPIQNVGAYGVEVSSLITKVIAINIETLKEKIFTNDDCRFSYRDSFFKTDEGRKWVVTQVVFKLSTKPNPQLDYKDLQQLREIKEITPATIRSAVKEIRLQKFPDWKVVGTAGSFFKNPIISKGSFEELRSKYPEIKGYSLDGNKIKVSLGWILDNVCGLRGYCIEGVCLYEKQALVLVNMSAKKAKTIDEFVEYVVAEVKKKTGIEIEREVRSV